MIAPRVRVSVIVPSCGRPLALTRCLLGLQDQERLPDEVLVAYREDDPATGALAVAWNAGSFEVVAINVGTANASVARNMCVARAKGDLLAFVDDDTVARRGWLAAIVRAFAAHRDVGAVGGPDWIDGVEVPIDARPACTGVVQWWGRRIGNHHRGANEPRDVEWLKGANMAFRRAAVVGIRFGDRLRGPAAQFAEDVAYSLRVRRGGWRLLYDPDAAVDHFPGAMPVGRDHRSLRDDRSLADAAYNDAVAMLDYLPPLRRLVFLAWSWLVGTRMLPGVVAAASLRLRGDALAAHRAWIVARARWYAWRGVAQPAATSDGAETASPTNGPLRICLVTHVVRPADGQGRVNFELARWLAQQGHHVTLVASDVDPQLLALAGVRWIRIAVPERAPEPVRWMLFAWRARRALGARPECEYDVVHSNGAIAPVRAHVNTSHFVHASWAPVLAALGPVSVHARYQRVVTMICSWLERRAYRSADNVVAVSESVRTALRHEVGVMPAQMSVIHTGVDTDEFRPRTAGERAVLRGVDGVPPDAFVVLFVGDAKTPRKNLDLAIRAIARLDDRVHLAIVGDATGGPYPVLAEQERVAERVHFLGMRPDTAALYREADLVFCVSHYEPASLVLLEAMASGTVVLAGSHVGNAVFIENGRNGFVIESCDDVARAASIIQELADHPVRRELIGAAARATAAALTWERMAIRYESLYRQLGARAVHKAVA